jgi:tetratricopeptide (TPR) repeat protein
VKRLLSLVAAASLLAACSAGRQSTWEAKPTASAGTGESSDALVTQGDEAWKKRDDETALKAAIAAWEKAIAAKPDDAATLTKLSHAYYFLADGFLRGKTDEYLTHFEKGVAHGEAALAAVSPKFKEHVTTGGKVEDGIQHVGKEGIEAMYWYAASLGKWARAKGFATTLGNKDRIKAVMTRVLELDPQFNHGAAHRYFGAYYAVAPGFAGGDMNKSKEHFDKSLQLAPDYLGTKVLMADVYAVKQQDRGLFEQLLDQVIAAPESVIPGLEAEAKVEKEKARELKAKIGELF